VVGSRLREKISGLLLTAIKSGDWRATLPPAGAESMRAGTARFESPEVGNLMLIVEGEMRISDEQAKVLGNQLKERAVAARGAAAPNGQTQGAQGKAQ
jgi:hypothetical protein